MEFWKRPALMSSAAVLAVGSLAVGCAAGSKTVAVSQQAASNAPAAVENAAASAVEGKQAAASSIDRPGAAEGELVVVTATVKAIDRKKRVVTLQYPDGKEAKIKCGPEVRNFAQIHVGDKVTAEFLDTVELFVTAPQGTPTANTSQALERAPLGSKPGMVAVETVEVTATVVAIDYTSREVRLIGPEGKTIKVKAGPEVKRLNEVKTGDTVVARLTEAVAIKVTAPK